MVWTDLAERHYPLFLADQPFGHLLHDGTVSQTLGPEPFLLDLQAHMRWIEGLHLCPAADSRHTGQMLAKCQALLKDRHCSERLLRCWGGHAGLDLKATQASIIQLLQVPISPQCCLHIHPCSLYCPFGHASPCSMMLMKGEPSLPGCVLHGGGLVGCTVRPKFSSWVV